jgi:hypothetical protein
MKSRHTGFGTGWKGGDFLRGIEANQQVCPATAYAPLPIWQLCVRVILSLKVKLFFFPFNLKIRNHPD